MTKHGHICIKCRINGLYKKSNKKCKFCGEFFCDYHIKPKLPIQHISKIPTNIPAWQKRELEESYRAEGGHPDANYLTYVRSHRVEEGDRFWDTLDRLKRSRLENEKREQVRQQKEYEKHERYSNKLPERNRKLKDYREDTPTYRNKQHNYRSIVDSEGKITGIAIVLVVVSVSLFVLYWNPEIVQDIFKNLQISQTLSYIRISNLTSDPEGFVGKVIQTDGKISKATIDGEQVVFAYNKEGNKIKLQPYEIFNNTDKNYYTLSGTVSYDGSFVIMDIIGFQKSQNCDENLINNQCSQDRPYQCVNGTLIKKSSMCGCPEDHSRVGEDCEIIQRCSDRTEYGTCSNKKPFYCNNGNLVETPDKCGCPIGLVNERNKCVDPNKRDIESIEQEILILVNEERQRYGSRELITRNELNSFARIWSDKMISQNFFEHSNLNFPYPSIAGENIGETPIHYDVIGCGSTYTDYQIARCFVIGWIDSPGHHENMIDKRFSMTGVGVSCDSSTCRATQVFSG